MRSMSEHSICPIWSTRASIEPPTGHGLVVDSPRAGGRYFIADSATEILKHQDEHLKARLTSWLIEQHRLGVDCPRILSTTVDEMAQRRSLSIRHRANNLLRYIRGRLPHIGMDFDFEMDRGIIEDPVRNETRIFREMLAWSESRETDELTYLLDYLEIESWLKQIPYGATCLKYRLTVRGYSYLAEIDHAVTDSSQAFVAMWFDESMDEVWEKGLRPAIRDAGYEALRIDRKEHLNKIDDEIIAEIRRSRFLVADFTHGETGPRGGVYYEAGFAQGLNIPVVFTCRKDKLETVHLDTRQYPHIVWGTPEELRDGLAKRISAVLGDGPLRIQVRATAATLRSDSAGSMETA